MSADADYSILGREVPVPSLDYELRHLWDADQVNTKASLINFAVYSEASEALLENTEIVREITREHACRAILIGAGLENRTSNARAWITAHCHLVDGRKSVCSEQVAFQLDGKAIGRIRNVVFAHMESDLPLVLWWQGEFSRIFEPKLYTIIDRLIVDSSSWNIPAEQFRTLRGALETAQRPMMVHDLSWTRTNAIRAAIATVFDDARWNAGLSRITKVGVCHAKGHRLAAVLVLAWLAEMLKWDGSRRGGRINFIHPGGNIQVELNELEADTAPVSRVELSAGEIEIKLVREQGSRFLRCFAGPTGGQDCRVAPADVDSDAELVSTQLARAGSNHIYKAIVPRVCDLM